MGSLPHRNSARRSQLPAVVLLAVIAAGRAASATRLTKSPEGNSWNIKVGGEAVSPQTPSGGGKTSGEITEWIGTNVSAELAADINAGLDPDTGFAKFVELCGGKAGLSDSGTIAVQTYRQPIWLCALVLMHEWGHCTAAHTANPNDPDKPDPAGKEADEVCGWCNEAAMGADDLNLLAQWACDPPVLVPPVEACNFAKEKWRGVGVALTNCVYSGCGSCCGFSYVPNAGELTGIPPCCN